MDLGLTAVISSVPAMIAVCWYGKVLSSWRAKVMTLDFGLVSLSTVLVEQYEGRRVMFELGFCSKPDSRSLAEQYEGMCDGDEGTTTTVLYTTLLHCIYCY